MRMRSRDMFYQHRKCSLERPTSFPCLGCRLVCLNSAADGLGFVRLATSIWADDAFRFLDKYCGGSEAGQRRPKKERVSKRVGLTG